MFLTHEGSSGSVFTSRRPASGTCAACLSGTPPNTTGDGRIDRLRYVRPRPDAPVPELIRGRIRRRPILGGLINEYKAAA